MAVLTEIDARGGRGNGSADEKEEEAKKKKKKEDFDDDDDFDDAKKTTLESFVTEDELRREIERLETETTRRERQRALDSMKTRAIQKRFEEARELAMAAKFRPERLKTEMKEEEIDERGKGVVFGEFDETDEKHVKELEKQGVAMEDVVSLPPQWQPTDAPAQYIPENELKYTNGDVYKGETVDQIRHGKGIHQCSNGDVYDGNWSEDKRHGFGTMTFTSGMTYTGDWVEDKTCGYGKCTYANGDVYEGEWKNDHRWGWGKHEWRSTTGDTYEGEWFDDIPEGEGIMVHIKDGKEEATFQGSFLNGFRKHGTYSTKDGTIEYVGSFTEGDLRHGKGVFFARGYYKYDGDWKLDKRDGKGKCSYDNGAGEYEGSWKDDMRHGKGIMFIPNEYEYDGAWKEDREEGKGTAKYLKTNEKYVGMFKESVPSGYGKRLYSDGSIYEGEFENGVRSGRGAFTNKGDGSKYRGEWKGDKKNGYGACQFSDGTVFRGEWKDDSWVQSTACPKNTKVFGNGIVSAVAGTNATFGIEARDELNNKRLSGGDIFRVVLTLQEEEHEDHQDEKVVEYGIVTDNDDGTYSISYSCTVAGTYTCDISIGDDEHVANSPYANLTVAPGQANAHKCKIRGDGLKLSKCFEESSFFVECRDSNENLCASPLENQVRIFVRITDASGNEIQLAKPIRVNDTGRGSYEVRYTPLKAGFYVVNVFEKKNGLNAPTILLGKSPYSMRVKDAGQLSDAPPPTEISSTSAKTIDGEETAQEEFAKFGAGNIAPPPRDLARDWLNIARSDYISVDKNDFGFDSSSEEEEDPDEKFARENPDTPVITNLEDVYKVPRLNKMLAEKRAREQAKKVEAMKNRLETKEKARQLKMLGEEGAHTTHTTPLGGLD